MLDEKQLWQACSDGKVEKVQNLLQNLQININKANNDGWAPFHVACSEGQIEIVKLLLNNQRVDINTANKDGKTPFYISCENGHIEIVKVLLNDHRVDINKASNNGETPLYVACGKGFIEVVKLLLNDKRVDINRPNNNNGVTPFYIACEKGYIEIVRLLLNDERVDINKADKNGQTPFFIACKNGLIEVAKYLLVCGREIDINKKNNDGKPAIDIARERGNEEKKDWENEKDFENRKRNYLKIIELIESFQLLNSASNGDINKFIKYFEDENIDANWKSIEFKETSLFIACKNGRLEIVEYMLASKRELDILSKDHQGILSLEIAKINSELQEKLSHEKKEIEVQQRQNNCLSIYNLLQEYQFDPKKVKRQLRNKLNLKGINMILFLY